MCRGGGVCPVEISAEQLDLREARNSFFTTYSYFFRNSAVSNLTGNTQ